MSNALWVDRTPESFLDDVWRYLTLQFEPDDADKIVSDLSQATLIQRRANDILRAAQLPPCDKEDSTVLNSMYRLGDVGTLPPVFLVVHKHRLIIADGYHRTSAVYWSNDFTLVDVIMSYA